VTAMDESSPVDKAADTAPLDQERRDALRRIAKYGAYTAPALLVMLASEAAVAVTGGGCT
jgi:hypothetical protein